MCFDFFSKFVWNIYRSKQNFRELSLRMDSCFHVKHALFSSRFNQSLILYEYFGNIFIHKILSKFVYSSRIVSCGRTNTQKEGRVDGKTGITKLTTAFHNFVKVPKT